MQLTCLYEVCCNFRVPIDAFWRNPCNSDLLYSCSPSIYTSFRWPSRGIGFLCKLNASHLGGHLWIRPHLGGKQARLRAVGYAVVWLISRVARRTSTEMPSTKLALRYGLGLTQKH